MSEPQVMPWSRILECLGLATGLPVRSLSPLCSLTQIYDMRMVVRVL